MKFVILGFISFIVTYVVTPLVIKAALKCGCVDTPGVRRFHRKATPRWGGLAFFAGVIPGAVFLFLPEAGRSFISYSIAAVVLITLGAIDDLKQLGWKLKFAGIIASASIVIFGGDVAVRNIGNYVDLGRVDMGGLSIPFTYFGIIGVTNAINLIDGLNGLAGGTSLLAFLFMGIAALISGNAPVAFLCFAFVGALLGFLRYNYTRARIFMGDSGSLFLGFSLAVVAILLTQDPRYPVQPTFPVLVMLLPIFDTLRVMFLRIFSLKNPFQADKTHLHHLIVRRKFSSSGSVAFLWGLTALFGVFALVLMRSTSTSFAIVILCSSLVLSFFADALSKRQRQKQASADILYFPRRGPSPLRGDAAPETFSAAMPENKSKRTAAL